MSDYFQVAVDLARAADQEIRERSGGMAEWALDAVVKYNTVVTVEAETAEEAREKFEAGEWLDAGFATAERIDWRSTGKPEEQ